MGHATESPASSSVTAAFIFLNVEDIVKGWLIIRAKQLEKKRYRGRNDCLGCTHDQSERTDSVDAGTCPLL